MYCSPTGCFLFKGCLLLHFEVGSAIIYFNFRIFAGVCEDLWKITQQKTRMFFYLLGDFQNTKRLAYADVSLFSEIETELCILDLSDE